MELHEMIAAVKDAERTMNLANSYTNQLAGLIVGRLRTGRVAHWVLRQLKKELAGYNTHTRQWRIERE